MDMTERNGLAQYIAMAGPYKTEADMWGQRDGEDEYNVAEESKVM